LKFSLHQEFPASLDRLWTAIGRADYPRRKYRALGSTGVQVLRFVVTDDLIEVELERNVAVAAADLPAWARPFAAGKRTLRQRTRWQRVAPARIDAQLEITPSGLPVKARAAGTVVELAPQHALMSLDFTVECKLPVLGGRIARLFAGQVREAMQADHAFTLAYLRGQAPAGR
jgi:hypothetical protein